MGSQGVIVMMTKQQMQMWVNCNCKFAMADKVDKFSTSIVSKITKASKEISGDQFVNIVMDILTKIASVPIPDNMQKVIKNLLLKEIKGKEKYNGQQMKQLMQKILLGDELSPGIARKFNYDINSPVLQNIMNEIISQIHELKGPADRPQGDYLQRKIEEEKAAREYRGPTIHFTNPKR